MYVWFVEGLVTLRERLLFQKESSRYRTCGQQRALKEERWRGRTSTKGNARAKMDVSFVAST